MVKDRKISGIGTDNIRPDPHIARHVRVVEVTLSRLKPDDRRAVLEELGVALGSAPRYDAVRVTSPEDALPQPTVPTDTAVVAGWDPSHSTSAWLTRTFGGRGQDTVRLRALFIEIGASPEYIAAADPTTEAERKRCKRDEAVVHVLRTFYFTGTRNHRALALSQDWDRFKDTTWNRHQHLATPPDSWRSHKQALHELCVLTVACAGESHPTLSVSAIRLIAATAGL